MGTSQERDLETLVDMLREASQSPDARQVLASFAKRLWTINPIDALVSLSIRGLPNGHFKVTRSLRREELDFSPGNMRLPDPWSEWDRIPAHTEGFLADLIREGKPQLFHHMNLRDDPVLGDRLADMRSAVATPLFDSGEPLNWNLQFRADPEGFTSEDLAAHVLQANLIGSITRNLIAVQREASLKQRLQHQLDELASVQQSLLPTTLPDIPGLTIAASYLTSDEAGGDYYDFVPLPDGRWGILIADVAGHGAAAAAVMAMLHAIVHSYQGEHSASGIVRYANARLVASSIQGRFATAFFGLYDPETSVMS
ncbi:MAG: SpoIIE family protein phosphatase, partial [Salinibacterium sp.]|nr:SpoIIE family protein phosphatase [Salinibacterium sp.]